MSLFTQLLGDQISAAENTKAEEQYVEHHRACALQHLEFNQYFAQKTKQCLGHVLSYP